MRSVKALQAKIAAFETPVQAIKDFKLVEIQLLIDKAAQRYYRTDNQNAIMTDECYDILIAELRKLKPDDERLTRVGIPYSTDELRNKISHPIPMGSLDNTDEGILGYEKWLNGVLSKLGVATAAVCASLKIDGGSIRLRYENGLLVEAATRGNGEVGENITANVANFQGVPTVLAKEIDIDVRGEAVLYIADYQKLRSDEAGVPFDQIPEKERSNPRNIGNGIIGRDDGTDSQLLQFIAFNVESGDRKFATEREKLEFLRSLGFKPVPNRICESVADLEAFYAATADQRDSLPFEIDGIVVILNSLNQQAAFITNDIKSRLRPKYARAIKFAHKSNRTILERVELTLGHTGAIIPIAVLKEVRIGGVNVTHALLNNWDEIARLGVAIDDEVEVVLAGDIIPKIIRGTKPGKSRRPISEPEQCPACSSPTTREKRGKRGAVIYCTNNACPEMMLQKIDHWIGSSKRGVGILGVGDTILRTIWDQRVISDPADLYTMTVAQIQDLEMAGGGRIGTSRAIEIVSNITAKKSLTLPVFLGSLGIELLGRRRVQLLQESANGQLDRLEDWFDVKLANIQIEGFGDAIRLAVLEGIDDNRDLITKLIKVGVVVESAKQKETDADGNVGPMANISFCFTGTRECIEKVQELGATITSSVAKSKPSPDFLVQKDPLSTSNKTKNADANGHTRVISLEYLKSVLMGKANLKDIELSQESDEQVMQVTQTRTLKPKIDINALAAELVK